MQRRGSKSLPLIRLSSPTTDHHHHHKPLRPIFSHKQSYLNISQYFSPPLHHYKLPRGRNIFLLFPRAPSLSPDAHLVHAAAPHHTIPISQDILRYTIYNIRSQKLPVPNLFFCGISQKHVAYFCIFRPLSSCLINQKVRGLQEEGWHKYGRNRNA